MSRAWLVITLSSAAGLALVLPATGEYVSTEEPPFEQWRWWENRLCKGLPADEGEMYKLDKVCEDCQAQFKPHFEVFHLCRSNCFTSCWFPACIDVLLLQNETETFKTYIKKIHGAEPEFGGENENKRPLTVAQKIEECHHNCSECEKVYEFDFRLNKCLVHCDMKRGDTNINCTQEGSVLQFMEQHGEVIPTELIRRYRAKTSCQYNCTQCLQIFGWRLFDGQNCSDWCAYKSLTGEPKLDCDDPYTIRHWAWTNKA